MKIHMKKTSYEKVNGKWIVENVEDKEITEEQYRLLKDEKWQGDRRTFQYDYEIGARLMVKLTSIEPIFKEIKSVREFTFKK